ncbi:unnamed protein product [Choristocarpus tenellus]
MAELFTLRPLFPGSSEADEIYKICSVLGSPTMENWAEGLKLAAHMSFQYPQFIPTPISQIVPNASPEAVALMTDLMHYDPNTRPTASQSLQYSFFQVNATLAPAPAAATVQPKGQESNRVSSGMVGGGVAVGGGNRKDSGTGGATVYGRKPSLGDPLGIGSSGMGSGGGGLGLYKGDRAIGPMAQGFSKAGGGLGSGGPGTGSKWSGGGNGPTEPRNSRYTRMARYGPGLGYGQGSGSHQYKGPSPHAYLHSGAAQLGAAGMGFGSTMSNGVAMGTGAGLGTVESSNMGSGVLSSQHQGMGVGGRTPYLGGGGQIGSGQPAYGLGRQDSKSDAGGGGTGGFGSFGGTGVGFGRHKYG